MTAYHPNTRSKFSELQPDGTYKLRTVTAMAITHCPGIVITAHTCNDDSIRYGLTHPLTGASLTGERLSADIGALQKKARAFWRLLSVPQRRQWARSNDWQEVRDATSEAAVRVLARAK